MAKRETSGKRTSSTTRKSGSTAKKQPAGAGRQAAPPSGNKEEAAGKTQKQVSLNHEVISERAKAIWRNRGCPPDQDIRNWLDAESELKQELGVS